MSFNATNGEHPQGALTISGNEMFGMTPAGAAHGDGNIFSVNTDGSKFKSLLDFNGTNGGGPEGSLTLYGSVLYGMTFQGGANNQGCIFRIDSTGSAYTDLFDLSNSTGYNPHGSLTLSGNAFYGMTNAGGASIYGDIFSFMPDSDSFKDLYDFTGPNGQQPVGSLILAGKRLYGMTPGGGSHSWGVVFGYSNLSLGINELNASSKAVKIYPNPSNGKFTFSLSHAAANSAGSHPKIEVYNLFGETLYVDMLNQVQHDYQIDLSSRPAGIYLYRVLSAMGNVIGSGKLIIEK